MRGLSVIFRKHYCCVLLCPLIGLSFRRLHEQRDKPTFNIGVNIHLPFLQPDVQLLMI
jgi:hypothetical protein